MSDDKFSITIEWPTLSLYIGLYYFWLLLTWQAGSGALWPYACLWLLVTLHSSLQHEAIHGHPTRSLRANTLLASPGIGLLLPFQRFKDLHLQHHRNESLTDPFDDTESYFMARKQWEELQPLHRKLLTVNNTLAGRLILGPWIMYCRFYRSEWKQVYADRNRSVAIAWLKHAVSVVPVILWLLLADMSLLLYMLAVVWPATSLLLLRSYTEHLPEKDICERTAIVTSSKFMGLLFLNNNLHIVHHDNPALPWYRIPNRYELHYAPGSRKNVITGYWSLIRKHAFTPRFPVAHPFLRTSHHDKLP